MAEDAKSSASWSPGRGYVIVSMYKIADTAAQE